MNQANKYEAPFNNKDLKIIKSKSEKANIAWFIFSIIMAFLSYGFLIKPGFGFVEFLIYLFFLISLLPYTRFFYTSPTERDIKDRVKVFTELKIKHKKRYWGDDPVFEIEFEENPDFYKYKLLEEDFDKVHVGDLIYIEYSKYGRWILKIEWNDQDIENPYYVK
ncbi:hypothetical protein [Arenibacter palladensis]|uniref:hypothetical protein n=1 Tax=Arenibacter palladensis TaxID=237373 RepID=UPI0026E36433|nr:hypothetical protein [Arenibacter palladensis]MDO6602496.1 hypothetical protein [Arenibacter palladensis]